MKKNNAWMDKNNPMALVGLVAIVAIVAIVLMVIGRMDADSRRAASGKEDVIFSIDSQGTLYDDKNQQLGTLADNKITFYDANGNVVSVAELNIKTTKPE